MSHAETTGWSDNDCCRERESGKQSSKQGWLEGGCCAVLVDLLQHCRHWLLPPHAPLVSGTVTVPSPTHSSVHCSPLSCCCPGRSLLCTSCNRTLAAEENGEDSHTSHRLTTSVTINLQRDMSLRKGVGEGGGEWGGRGGEEQKVVPRLIMQTHTHTLNTPIACPSVWTWCVFEK